MKSHIPTCHCFSPFSLFWCHTLTCHVTQNNLEWHPGIRQLFFLASSALLTWHMGALLVFLECFCQTVYMKKHVLYSKYAHPIFKLSTLINSHIILVNFYLAGNLSSPYLSPLYCIFFHLSWQDVKTYTITSTVPLWWCLGPEAGL